MDAALFHGDLVESNRILYTPSNFAKKSLTHLQEIGELHAQKPHICRRENLDSYLFFMVLSGSGQLKYGGNTFALSNGDCVFIDCRKDYFHETSENLWRLEWVHFYGANMANIYEKYVEQGGQPRFHPSDLTLFESIWQRLFETTASFDHIRDMRINEELNSLLTLIMGESCHSDSHDGASKRQNLLEIRNYLDEHYFDKISLDELAGKFFINKFYLTRVFKEQFGLSINNYLLQIRITHAKHLLRFTDKTVETIGFECGMGAVHYFSRVFKKVEGISPSEYRRMW